MLHFTKTAVLSIVLLSSGSDAFVAPSRTTARPTFATLSAAARAPRSSVKLYNAETDKAHDDEIERLRSMAAKLRAEAAVLEAEKAQDLARAAEKAFHKFDVNAKGEIGTAELKAGLEKELKMDLSEERVQALMKEFDASGDGALQLEEFVTVEKFRNRLEALAREEKRLASEAAKQAKLEEEVAKALEARVALLNDSPPTTTDKLVSVLPYLFPLLDGLQFGRFLLEGQDNPAIAVIALLYTLYRSIPFSGFVVFLALQFLSNNPSLNRLVRFNMQQAIFLDIALFFPGLIAAVYTLILSGLGVNMPPAVTEIGSDVLFASLILTIGYATISSALGITPDKVPVISKIVSDRMPTIDMFDEQGRFVPRRFDEDDDKKDKKD